MPGAHGALPLLQAPASEAEAAARLVMHSVIRAEIVPPRPAKRDILWLMVAGCVAFNHRENETS
ncbi:MAG: hypothetical protein ING90_17410 [Rhodocyclaceae bacterium]|jgi:hypothetical protein|nr:hypothetical protein [Rhodocyclaceae bacterium]MCE2979623.1 hypothetical protein [Betaproteobacteria bacterium]MCA3076477.1 hypothetical protein [Rhodocyclaceae bacterium]MCA3089073.1 hypothetical protein [Rhodocyclaceae bacterium]MCA3095809.1 hypothetical protein [Rhodocyclaceae bacterium]